MSIINGLVKGLTLGNYELTTTDDPRTMTLKRAKWTTEEEETLTLITSRVVWPGGAEKEVTYVDHDYWNGPEEWVDENDNHVLDLHTAPAFTEELDREEITRTIETSHWVWVSSVPDHMEATGETREVYYG